jgi:hypothetical protein
MKRKHRGDIGPDGQYTFGAIKRFTVGQIGQDTALMEGKELTAYVAFNEAQFRQDTMLMRGCA